MNMTTYKLSFLSIFTSDDVKNRYIVLFTSKSETAI